jgi:hypothetical protein
MKESTEAPTPEQVKESNQMIEEPIDSKTAAEIADEAIDEDTESVKKKSANIFNQCKVS